MLSILILNLLKFRFRRTKTIKQTIQDRYKNNSFYLFNNLKKQYLKTEKLKLDLYFLNFCFDFDLIPKFLLFKTSNKLLHNSLSYKDCQRKLLSTEISNKERDLKKSQVKYNDFKSTLKLRVSKIDFLFLINFIFKTNKNKLNHISLNQNEKLNSLQVNKTDRLEPNKIVLNYSKRKLSEYEINVLSYGLKFSVPPLKINKNNYLTSFETAYKCLENNLQFLKFDKVTELKESIKNIALKSFFNYKYDNNKFNFSKRKLQILKNLSKDPNIIILKSDKSNQVVVMDKVDYINKLNDIISDRSKFELINTEIGKQIRLQEKRVTAYLLKFKKSNVISKEIYDKLHPVGTLPGRLYGLPKTHKNNIPLRPILSAINTPTYNIAKFLVPLIQPLSINKYTIKDTKDFVDRLKQFKLNNHNFMVSFDVESLFTNIPLEETVEICLNLIYADKPNNFKYNNFSREDFKILLNLAIKETYFLCNSKLYKQIDGVAMGNPLAPVLANLFLSFHENKWVGI